MKHLKTQNSASNSIAVKNSSGSSPQVESFPIFSSVTDGVRAFAELLMQGVSAWVKAGQILEQLVKRDKAAFSKVKDACPFLSDDQLWAFYKIGTREFRPELMLVSRWLFDRLSGLDYDQQSRLLDHPIDVVVSVTDGKPLVRRKAAQELTRIDLNVIFDGGRMRTVQEQAQTFSAPCAKRDQMEKPSARIVPSAVGKSAGLFRLTFRFGKPSIVPIPRSPNASNEAAPIKLNSDLGDPARILEIFI